MDFLMFLLIRLQKMRPAVYLGIFLLCLVSATRPTSFESQEVVPVRVGPRIRGRFWKRSEEQPSFSLSAFGRRMTLNLTPDTSFMSPAFTIHRIRSVHGVQTTVRSDPWNSRNQTEESEGDLRSCFYSGSVDQEENSLVAVSLCSGIFGSFITDGTEYVIEPKLHGNRGPDAAERLHIIGRRTVTPTRGAPLLFDGSEEDRRAEETRGEESLTRGGGDARREARSRRFVSAPRFIETLVVADSTMTYFYGDEIKVR